MRQPARIISRSSPRPRGASLPLKGPLPVGAVTWFVVDALLFLILGLELILTSDVALNHWYLLSLPMIIAGFRFGKRGAIYGSLVAVVIIMVVFRAAGQTFTQVTGFVESLVGASTSVDEARRLALRLADLRAADPQAALYRALSGMAVTIVGTVSLGVAVDNRTRAVRLLEQAFSVLRRYFSPEIIDRILSEPDVAGAPPVSVRKEITLLFADLRDFTALSERLEPEDVARLLNDFFGAMTEEIHREGGTLDKYLGDGIMAFFGDPVWHPDHPERAFRAALGMRQRMQELQAAWEAQGRESVQVGIGISTGYAVVGNTGAPTRMEYTAIGSTVNIASRLSDLAAGGTILTTRKSYARVQHVMDGAPREPTTVKGFRQPIEIVEIVGARLAPRAPDALTRPHLHRLISEVMNDSAYRAALLANPAQAAGLEGLSPEERTLAVEVAGLCGHPFLHGLSPDDVVVLVTAAVIQEVARGVMVVREGAEPDNFFLILEGDVVVTMRDELGQERHAASLAKGDFFGEVAVLFDTTRIASVRARTPCRLLVLSFDGFQRVTAQSATFRERVEGVARSRMTRTLPLRFDDPASSLLAS